MTLRGISFPLKVLNGNLSTSEDSELYADHIRSWLMTDIGQRVMRPSYGMKDYLFETISDISYITSSIKEGLQDYIPEVNFEVQGSLNDSGEVEVYVYWSYQGDESTLKVTL